MRHFLVIGHDAATHGAFPLEDLPGSAGRLDILVRCVTASFVLSHDIRRDTILSLCLLGPPAPPKHLRFVGRELQHLNPDERSTAALIRRALALEVEGPSTPGISVGFEGLEALLGAAGGSLVYLREEGEDLREVPLPDEPTFLLSDHRDPTPQEEAQVLARQPRLVSVGPLALHADHCIALVHNELDRREARGS